MMKYLPDRPVGVRKSWRRESCDPLWAAGQLLKKPMPVSRHNPIEAQSFKDRRGNLRRLEVLFADGETASLRFNKAGYNLVLSQLKGAALLKLEAAQGQTA